MANHKTGVTISCANCGKAVYIPKSRIRVSDAHCCSLSCVSAFYWKHHRKYPRVIGVCIMCGYDIVAKNGSFDKPNRRTCSRRCRTILLNKTVEWSPARREKARQLASRTFRGRTVSPVTRERQRQAFLGAKSHFWKGGLTDENRKLRNSPRAREWRKAVFARDAYTCQICHKQGGYLNADHIKPWSKYPALRFELSNGRTLCRPCHYKTDTFGYKAIMK